MQARALRLWVCVEFRSGAGICGRRDESGVPRLHLIHRSRFAALEICSQQGYKLRKSVGGGMKSQRVAARSDGC